MSDQAETGHSSAMWEGATANFKDADLSSFRIPVSYLDVTLSPEVKWEAQARFLLQQLLAERLRCAEIVEPYNPELARKIREGA